MSPFEGFHVVAVGTPVPRRRQERARAVQGTRFALPKGSRFRVDHIPGSAEPLLWVADVVAGVIRASRQGSPVLVELTGERVHVLEVPTNC